MADPFYLNCPLAALLFVTLHVHSYFFDVEEKLPSLLKALECPSKINS
jgi:hypothetical protein